MRCQSGIRNSKSAFWSIAIALFAFLLLAPLRLFEIGNPDWRPLNWLHAAAVVALTLVFLGSVGGVRWVRHFAFPVAFIFVAVPWVSAIEQPIVQGLMRVVAVVATEITNLCGIPAQVEGNLIRLNTGLVGVNEACSGVRSIQTSLMIGLLFGELRRLTVPRRLALVAIALTVAIVGNFARAFSLVWVSATREKEVFTSWHDIAGYSIVGAVFVAAVIAASMLSKGEEEERARSAELGAGSEEDGDRSAENGGRSAEDGGRNREDGARSAKIRGQRSEVTQGAHIAGPNADRRRPTSGFLLSKSAFRLPTFPFLLSLSWLFAVEVGAEMWYRAHEAEMVPRAAWTVRWPESAADFRDIPIEEEIKVTLRFDEGREAAWLVPVAPKTAGARPRPDQCLLYFFRWNPGGSSIVRARAHRPDICLPSAGWRMISDSGTRDFDAGPGLALPFRRVSFAPQAGAGVAHTFFCLYEDQRTKEARPDLELAAGLQPDWSFPARWQAVRQGVRNMGQQVMEFILLTSNDVSPEEADAQFAELLPTLIKTN